MKLNKDKLEMIRLKKLSHKIEYGLTASSEDFGDTILLRITDVNENGTLNEGLRFATVDEKIFSKYELKTDDVLIARSGATAGKAYIHKSNGKFIFASYMLRIGLKKEILNPDFFFSFLNSPNYLSQLSGIKVGSAQPNVNTVNLATLQIPLPPLAEQKQIINHAVSTSAGSLSPRTKWKDLAELEVSIPDLTTQGKILDVFTQLQTTLQQLKQQRITLQHFKQKLLNEILG